MSALAEATIALEHLCEMAIDLEPAQIIPTPLGMRLTYIVRHGSVTGERLSGEILPGGGDWLVFGSDGIGRLDVRATLRTHDGVLVHLTTTGVAVLSDGAKARLGAGERIAFDEMHTRSQVRFETGDERYAWLNATTTVAINELAPDHVGYRVFRVL